MKIELEFDTDKRRLDIGLGLAIILAYEPTTKIWVDEVKMWAGNWKLTYDKMTESERTLMRKCGWVKDDHRWHSYVSIQEED